MMLAHQFLLQKQFAVPLNPTHLHASEPTAAGDASRVSLPLAFIIPAHQLHQIQLAFPSKSNSFS